MLTAILLAVVPSLLTGLIKSTTLPRWASVLLQIASVVTHPDQPGTYKLPLVVKPEAAPKP